MRSVNGFMKSFLRSSRTIPADHQAFASLPVEHVIMADGRTRVAVHRRGRFAPDRMPLVCLAGYHRNMSDFSVFAERFQRLGTGDWPLVLIDLPGRGRADDRKRLNDYSSLSDAEDLADTLNALGLKKVLFLGQGHGGQVAMVFAAAHPLRLGGTILLDSGPMTDSRGIVRLRNNMQHIASLRGAKTVEAGFRRILGGDYPGKTETDLAAMALRTHWFDKRGRARPLFDDALLERIKDISFDDVLVPQWPLFDALSPAPLMILRTQLTDQLRRETFDEMTRRRPDAIALSIAGQGSPALLDQQEEIEAIAEFVFRISAGATATKTR